MNQTLISNGIAQNGFRVDLYDLGDGRWWVVGAGRFDLVTSDKSEAEAEYRRRVANTMLLSDLPVGASIQWEGRTWTVLDVRRHAVTREDGTAWLILDGWQGDPPKPLLSTEIVVNASFS